MTRELLSEVLDIKINMVMNPKNTPSHLQKSNELTYFDENNFVNQINIYELASKCKEWAYKQGNGISSSIEHPAYTTTCNVIFAGQSVYSVEADTEPEAIFKAAQWILERKDK